MKSRIVQPAASFQPPETCTEHEECLAAQTPIEDLRRNALEHYEKVTGIAHEWYSVVPKAISAYFDNLAPVAQPPIAENNGELFQVASRVLRWLYATMNPKLPIDKSLLKVTQFEIHRELELAILNAHAAQVRARAAASLQPPSPQSEEIAKQIIERSLKEYNICGRTLNALAKDIATEITRGAELQREVDANSRRGFRRIKL